MFVDHESHECHELRKTEVGLLLDQARDLTSILSTLNRDYGARI